MTNQNSRSQQVDAVTAVLSDLRDLAPSGFAVGLHITFSTPSFMFQTYPPDWMAHYTQNGLILQDPTVLWGFANIGRVDWADLEDTSTAKVMEQAAEYGLAHGLTLSIKENGSRSIASFANGARPFTPEEADRIEAGVRKLHDMTATDQDLSESTVSALRSLSIKLTH